MENHKAVVFFVMLFDHPRDVDPVLNMQVFRMDNNITFLHFKDVNKNADIFLGNTKK